MIKHHPRISVIVPTKNSALTLVICLESIKRQSYSNLEIIVVDNYSTDETIEIAKKYGVNVVFGGYERSSQRNLGAKNADSNYLLFIDSDMELTTSVVSQCVEAIFSKEAVAVVIPELSVGEGFWSQCKSLEKLCYLDDDTIEAARFFKAEIFWEVGGYDEDIAGGGEDWDLPLRFKERGCKITRINAYIKHHEGRLSLQKLMRKKSYYAETIGKYIHKHPSIARRQLIPFRPAFFRNWRILSKYPIHAVGMVLMKMCEFTAGGIGFLKGKLHKLGSPIYGL